MTNLETRAIAAIVLAVGWSLLFPMPSLADHGSWTAHSAYVFESGPSNYGGYSHVNASDRYDFGYARFKVKVNGTLTYDVSATCYEINEGCSYLKTSTKYWAQTSSDVYFDGCAKDGSHFLGGVSIIYTPCSPKGIETHIHNWVHYS